jgi:hypothetical protein
MTYLSKLVFQRVHKRHPELAHVVSHTQASLNCKVFSQKVSLPVFHLLIKLIVYLLQASVGYVLYFKFAARHVCHDCKAASSAAYSLPTILARKLRIPERQQVMQPNCLPC